ncbi:MAG TPA: aldo/keto reductase [Geminicoccaceae bacterium]|nr:aldo/keto reductase [Geminicoccaceae bacterium]
MRYRAFGRTGVQVSELVFGGGFVGGILIHADDDTKLRALRRGLDGGMNWIDTAPSYGDGKSEEALGWLLQEVDSKPHLSTKVGLDLSRADLPGQIEASLEQSLRRLRRDSVDLFQLHNPIGPEPAGRTIGVQQVLGANGVAATFERLRDHGLFRFTGITALGDAVALRDVIASGRFDSAQVYYNLLNPSAGQHVPAAWAEPNFADVLAACREHGVATMNIRVLAAGVIATDMRHGREMPIVQGFDMRAEEARVRAVFAKLGDRHGTRAQTAIRFALANPDLSCVVVGFAEIAHIEEALAGAEMGPLPAEALAALREVYAAPLP